MKKTYLFAVILQAADLVLTTTYVYILKIAYEVNPLIDSFWKMLIVKLCIMIYFTYLTLKEDENPKLTKAIRIVNYIYISALSFSLGSIAS